MFELIVNSMPVKTSYSFVYYKFKYIFDKVAVPGLAPKCNKCTFVTNLVKSTKNNTAIETLKAVFAVTLDTYKINNFTVIATDASISSISTGCAVFFIQLSHFFLFKIDSKLSSLTGELIAIWKTLQIAAEDGLKKIAIFTDSLNACKLLDKNYENYIF